MARYIGPVCRFCRTEGTKLYLKGDRCNTEKCSFDRRNYAPGMHGKALKGKASEFKQQLREKQKVKRVYGLLEGQFRLTFKRAAVQRGVTSELFFRALETRLDNVVYRMGFARSRTEARQVVSHYHVLVNGKRLNIPSANVKVGDVVSIKPSSLQSPIFASAQELFARRSQLGWFQVDGAKYTGKVVADPKREDIQLPVTDRMIVEFYSK